MSGWLSTHVLDTANGTPAKDVALALWRIKENPTARTKTDHQLIKTVRTNADGRTDAPLLEGKDFDLGLYEIVFEVGDYFAKLEAAFPKASLSATYPFLSSVPLRFGIADLNAHYHVPLLVSPWSYSTYRGS